MRGSIVSIRTNWIKILSTDLRRSREGLNFYYPRFVVLHDGNRVAIKLKISFDCCTSVCPAECS
jgi:hypothetical protein